MEPNVEVLGMALQHPWTVLTNLVLAAECLLLGTCTARGGAPAARLRAWFFFSLGLGALFGAPKHGLPQMAGHEAVRLASNLGVGAAVTFAQLAAIRTRVSNPGTARILRRLVFLQLGVFLVACTVSRDFVVPGVNLAVGVIPVLAASFGSAVRGRSGDLWISLGLGVAVAAGAVYALQWAPAPWFNHVDVAHVLLLGTVGLVFHGIHRPGWAGTPEAA